MDKLVAGFGEGHGGLGLSHADNVHILLSQAHGQTGKVAVTGH